MREEKKLLLEEIKEDIKKSNSIIVTKHNGMKPEDSWNLSKILGKNKFKVVKKRIFKKALEDIKISFEMDLEGHIGVVFIEEDPFEAIKVFYKFKKDNDQLIEIIAGKIEEETCSKEDIAILSKLPGKNEMRAQILGLLEAPMSNILSLSSNLLTSIPFCLKNKKEKDEVNRGN